MIFFSNVSVETAENNYILKRISLRIPSGKFSIILGPSGAGKTTLLRLVNGLVIPTSGKVLVNNETVSSKNLKKVRVSTGMIFQQANLVNNLSVLNNVLIGSLGLHQKWWSNLYIFPDEIRLKALGLLDKVGLLDKAYTRAEKLSGGEQQRVGIARALMQDPKVILADEPIASLDPGSSHKILSLLKSLSEREKITVLCSLHQPEMAMMYADRIVGLSNGEIVLEKKSTKISKKQISEIYDSNKQTTDDDNYKFISWKTY
jgi:phosphonate transport system ATP-binding protein